jgi:hypothetical protein
MEEELKKSWILRFVYKVLPPVLRVLEKLKFHNYKQPWVLGHLSKGYSKKDLRKLLVKNGFEDVILTWRDPGEVLGMRKVDKGVFQYHVRLFDDGEIRGHYEYSSEGHAWNHAIEKGFEPRQKYFEKLLGRLLSS